MISICFLSIYLFTTAGYQLLFSCLTQYGDQQLTSKLDHDQYSDADLVEFKIPLHLPYYNNQTDYEKVQGEVRYGKAFYSYVKRKVANDTLYILCLKNEVKTNLHMAQAAFEKQHTDLPADKNHSSLKKLNSLSEHQQSFAEVHFGMVMKQSVLPYSYFSSRLCSAFQDGAFQPPEDQA